MVIMFYMCCKVWYWLFRVGVCVFICFWLFDRMDFVWVDVSVFFLKKKKIKRGKFGRYGNFIVNVR